MKNMQEEKDKSNAPVELAGKAWAIKRAPP
jgi:hypothetical protein